ncbi:MAG: phosphotransferase enzyme family protein [Opitutaceae bacterium]
MQLIAPFKLRLNGLRLLRNGNNYVYSARHLWKPVIIRIKRLRPNQRNTIDTEIKWIWFLDRKGISVRKPFTRGNRPTYTYTNIGEHTYLTTCFTKAPGKKISCKSVPLALYKELGSTLGRLHTASANFEQECDVPPIKNTLTSQLMRERHPRIESILDTHASYIDELINDLNNYPKNDHNFGLIHGDYHHGNCCRKDAQIWLFDFENIQMNYYIADLATFFLHSIYAPSLLHITKDETIQLVTDRLKTFLTAYNKIRPQTVISKSQLEKTIMLKIAVHQIYTSSSSTSQYKVWNQDLHNRALHFDFESVMHHCAKTIPITS